MSAIKRFLVVVLGALLCATVVPAQDPPQDVTILIQQQQVRFTSLKGVEQMRLQVFDQSGELVFDSQPQAVNQLDWLWQGTEGNPVKGGLYAYTLTVHEAGAPAARVRRGHFIVDRAKDQDGKTDRLWVTSQNDSGVGTELTVMRDETATVAGAAMSSGDRERTVGQRAGTTGRDAAGRTVEAETQSPTKAGKEAAAAAAGTVGRIAKFTSTADVGDSVITENNGSIGIGTATPQSKLEVNGTMGLKTGGSGGEFYFHTPAGETGLSILGSSRADIRFDGSTLKLVAGPIGGPPPAERGIAINTSGNVGVGTATPSFKLDVAGNLRAAGSASNDILVETAGGTNAWARFGMKTANQAWFLGTSQNFNGDQFYLYDDTYRQTRMTIQPNAGEISFPSPSSNHIAVRTSGGTNAWAQFRVQTTNQNWAIGTSQNFNGDQLYFSDVSRGQIRMAILTNGNVGIGTTDPQAKLDVAGRTRTGSLEIVGGADFAENFDINFAPSDHRAAPQVTPGMVVTIDPARQGKLALSRRAYDRRVAGIVSGAGGVKPGMTMGQEQTLADGKYPVALSGRVYVWADARRGAIRAGDLLTTARTPGHAMEVTDSAKAQGAVIGKAMTGLKSGKGLVLVLVSLQ